MRPESYASWTAWRLDVLTWLWIVWLVQFAVLEFVALKWHPGQELTAHLRPLFLTFPVLWWTFLGVYLWLGVHFFAPTVERGLLSLLRG